LYSQIQRVAVSIPSNIAEGIARDSTKEFLQFISVTLCSLALKTQLILAEQLAYVDATSVKNILCKTDEIQRMLRGLQKSLKAKL
jgi:four helix bundle protein